MTAVMATGRLAGKAAVVTGAAGAIGSATVAEFLAEGARVLATDLDAAGLERLRSELGADGSRLECAVADIADEAGSRGAVERCAEVFGAVDIAVANAGVFLNATAREVSAADWDRVMAVDGRGTFLTCKHAIERMVPAGGGSIVCVSSISGLAGQTAQAAYGPAKFIASGLTMHLAVEWAGAGIRVNAVAPGTIRTEGLENEVPEDKRRELAAAHPLGRFGEADEVARAIAFLASEEASFITGAVVPVDGGYLAQ
jgi:NAD(P)-dependent dehydrogenase (short-subunit alcohol dehydrogenase family)